MGFVVLILYLILWYLRPFELDRFDYLAAYRPMLWCGVVALAASFPGLLDSRRLSLRIPQVWLMGAFTFVVGMSVAGNGWLGGALPAVEDFVIASGVFFLVILNVNSLARLRILIAVIVSLSLIQVVQGLMAYHFDIMGKVYMYAEKETDAASGAVYTLKRIQSLGYMNNPNNLAQGLLLAVPLLGFAWRRQCWFRNLLFVLGPMALLVYGIYLTFSRTAVVGLGVVALLAFRDRLGRTSSVLITALLLFVLLALEFGGGREFSSQEGSASERIYSWSEGISMLKSSPLLGMGYGSYEETNNETHLTAHNSFVLCFAELGLFGYFVWLSLLAITSMELSSVKRLPEDENFVSGDLGSYARAIEVSFFGFLACCFFASRTYNLLLFMLVGMGAALGNIARKEGRPTEIPPLYGWARLVAGIEMASIGFIYAATRLGMRG